PYSQAFENIFFSGSVCKSSNFYISDKIIRIIFLRVESSPNFIIPVPPRPRLAPKPKATFPRKLVPIRQTARAQADTTLVVQHPTASATPLRVSPRSWHQSYQAIVPL